MQKLIIALDYGPWAEKVAKIGYKMAEILKAEVTLVHVVSDPVYYSNDYKN
ncbi:MAG: universal stress protein [Chitinophagaceae bacterium]|nr:universal stress protein [Chitinophagaceae bacterium]